MRAWTPALALHGLLLSTPGALAHVGMGAGGGTPFAMPGWVVWVTGAIVVLVSLLLVGGFLNRASDPRAPPLPREDTKDADAPHRVPWFGWALGLATLALLVAHGVLPTVAGPYPVVLVWLVLWGSFPLLAYALGNFWPYLNPFRALAPLADRLRLGRAPLPYPRALGRWPAAALVLTIVGLELAPGAPGADPRLLGRLTLGYALLTMAGMTTFGSSTWLHHGEVFEVLYRWWGTFAPVQRKRRGVGVTWPGAHLLREPAGGVSEAAFLVAVLYGLNLDGFLHGGTGLALREALAELVGLGIAHVLVLLAGYALFLGAFTLGAVAIRRIAPTLQPLPQVMGGFAVALVPIAVGYHLAHNLPLLLERLPLLAALGDPLGLGWGLLGPVDGSFTTLPASWAPVIVAVQMTLLVLGHVAAVVVAHHRAVGAFPSRVQALRSQVPLAAVMVAYTMMGLWLLAQGRFLEGGMPL